MKSLYALKTLDQVKVLANPLRLRILEAFSQKAMTTKQLAKELGGNPTRLYHHVDALLQAGLIHLVRTQQNRGTTEKYFNAIAKEFIVDRGYLEFAQGEEKVTSKYEVLFLNALRATLQEAKESVAAGLIRSVKQGRNAFLYRRHISESRKEIKSIMKKISKLIETCKSSGKNLGQTQFGLTVVFYPLAVKKKK
jgi:DNA-binding transcriptional ArsR family regulator